VFLIANKPLLLLLLLLLRWSPFLIAGGLFLSFACWWALFPQGAVGLFAAQGHERDKGRKRWQVRLECHPKPEALPQMSVVGVLTERRKESEAGRLCLASHK